MYTFAWIMIIFLVRRTMVKGKYVPCKGTLCGKSSMPLVDDVRAPLYAELDTDSLNRQLKRYIDTNVELEISETLTNKTEVMDQKLEHMKIDMMTDITELKEEMQAINSKLNTLLNLDKERQDKLSTRNPGDEIAKDCKDLNPAEDGIYFIRPKGYLTSVKVYCETKTDGGGWTVIQRRSDGSVSFYKGWNDYEDGFGNLDGEHWLGNKLIHAITSQRNYELRIDLEGCKEKKLYATYSKFLVGNSKSKYKLTLSGYDGDAGDAMNYHNGMKFSTRDQDNDQNTDKHCAQRSHAAWWHKSCYDSNLNGLYNGTGLGDWIPIISWYSLHTNYYSLKSTRMMIR